MDGSKFSDSRPQAEHSSCVLRDLVSTELALSVHSVNKAYGDLGDGVAH